MFEDSAPLKKEQPLLHVLESRCRESVKITLFPLAATSLAALPSTPEVHPLVVSNRSCRGSAGRSHQCGAAPCAHLQSLVLLYRAGRRVRTLTERMMRLEWEGDGREIRIVIEPIFPVAENDRYSVIANQ